MELVYGEDPPVHPQYRLMAVDNWPYARIAQPGDRALFWCERPGAERWNFPLWAPIPKGIVKLIVSSSVRARDLVTLGPDGTVTYSYFDHDVDRHIAQALQDGKTGDLVYCYWLGG